MHLYRTAAEGGLIMHSRIFQIEAFPVDADYRITEDNYIGDHWFVYSVADYVAADEDRTGSLEWLRETLKAGASFIEYFTDEDGEGFILHEGFHAAYFTAEYRAFSASLNSLLEKASPEAFADGGLQSAMFSLEEAYDDKYGFYIDCDEIGLVTLNRFLRQARPETRYYIGGTVDYHY